MTAGRSLDELLAFDERSIERLIRDTSPVVERVIERYPSGRSMFASMGALDVESIDVNLLYRQSYLAIRTGQHLGLSDHEISELIEFYASMQTFILNTIDRHLDLSTSYTLDVPKVLLKDVRSLLCFAPHSIFSGINKFSGSNDQLGRIIRATAGVTDGIVQSMFDEYRSRYSSHELSHPDELRRTYQSSLMSRHLGSGFYASSVLLMYSYVDERVDARLVDILDTMRRIRQRVDELADLYDDIATGLLTYPFVLGLCAPEKSSTLRGSIESLWRITKRLDSKYDGDAEALIEEIGDEGRSRAAFVPIRNFLVDEKVLEICSMEALSMCDSVAESIPRVLGSNDLSASYVEVIELKRAFLERLRKQGWEDVEPTHSLTSIRRKHLGGEL